MSNTYEKYKKNNKLISKRWITKEKKKNLLRYIMKEFRIF